MLRLLFTLAAFSYTGFATAQNNIKKYVQENTVTIKTIEPDSTDFSDLEAFGNAVGNSKIVMLGEQDHGDAPTFLAKTRLIKYLHEKKGFNVLAFESDFFGLNYNWDFVKSGALSADSFIRDNIYPLWTYCNTCKDLFYQYIPSALKTSSPLELTGFDNQIYSKALYPALDSVLRKVNIPITRQEEYSTKILPLLRSFNAFTGDSTSNTTATNYLLEIKVQLLKVFPPENFWIMTVDNLLQEYIELRNYGKDYWKDQNTRDRQMAVNLNWLAKVKYPEQKIIVWAANYHVSKFAGHYPDEFMNIAQPMGSVFTTDTANMRSTYILGFSSYEGKRGRVFKNKEYKVDTPKKNSFENWIDRSAAYTFTDFTKYNTAYPDNTDDFYMSGAVKGGWYIKNDKAQWNKIYDGIFFIRTMYACKE